MSGSARLPPRSVPALGRPLVPQHLDRRLRRRTPASSASGTAPAESHSGSFDLDGRPGLTSARRAPHPICQPHARRAPVWRCCLGSGRAGESLYVSRLRRDPGHADRTVGPALSVCFSPSACLPNNRGVLEHWMPVRRRSPSIAGGICIVDVALDPRAKNTTCPSARVARSSDPRANALDRDVSAGRFVDRLASGVELRDRVTWERPYPPHRHAAFSFAIAPATREPVPRALWSSTDSPSRRQLGLVSALTVSFQTVPFLRPRP